MSIRFCIGGVWNHSSLIHWKYPIVTDCFQYLLLLIPSGLFNVLFVIFAVVKLGRNCDRKREVGFDFWYFLKLILRVVLTVLVTVEGVIVGAGIVGDGRTGDNDPLMIAAFVSLGVSMLLTIIQTEISRVTEHPMYPLLLTFWLTVTLAYLVRFYGNLIRFINSNQIELSIGFILPSGIIFLLFLLNLIIECCFQFPDRLMKKKKMQCPEEYASIPSKLTYIWLDKFIYQWYKTEMTEETVFNTRPEDKCSLNTNLVEKTFTKMISKIKEKEIDETVTDSIEDSSKLIMRSQNEDEYQTGSGWIIFKSLMREFGVTLAMAWLSKVLGDSASYVMPFLLKLLLKTVQEKTMPNWMGYMFPFAFLICGIISSLCVNYCFFLTSSAGIKIRTALIGMIYRKTIRIENEARNKFSSGEIINLMAVDAERIMISIVYSWFLISCPFQFILATILLYQEMGIAVFAGLCVIVVFFPLTAFLMKLMYQFSDVELKWKDDRVKVLTEILNGIKILKMYAWEKSFLSKVGKIRNEELKYICSGSFVYAFICVVWEMLPFITLLVIFLTFINLGGVNIITAERAFVSLSLFNLLRHAVILLPWCLADSISAFVSLKRIEEFLTAEEVKERDGNCFRDKTEDNSDDAAVEINEGYFSWKKKDKMILNKINIEIEKGKLVAIVGKVGTGKSSLISAILGEMHTIGGSVKIRGKIAYVSQEAWIQNKSLKENILFTKKYNEEFYKKVVKSCALERDLDQLPGRDETEIGERGINLSGGQKQRVSLARSVYQNQDIYLLDDPLSAVDAHVGEYLFENVISNNGILNGKTRILVTHGLNWLPKVDEVFVLDNNGHISERGSYKELLKNSDDFMQFVHENMKHNKCHTEISTELELEGVTNISKAKEVPSYYKAANDLLDVETPRPPKYNYLSNVSTELSANDSVSVQSAHIENIKYLSQIYSHEIRKHKDINADEDLFIKPLSQLTDEEEAMSGTVKWTTYLIYLRSRGSALFILTVLMGMIFIGIQIFSNMWLEWFTTDKILQNASANFLRNSFNLDALRIIKFQTQYYIVRYMYIGLGMTFAVSIFWICFTIGSVRASKVIHEILLYTILRSPMRFFDTTPSGRIINRFSRDIELLDHSIPANLGDTISSFFTILGSVVVIVYVTPWFATVIVPLLILYYFIPLFYMPTARQSRRLDSIASSPVFNHFTETLQGISLIRAFNKQVYFQKLNQKLVDRSSKFKFIQFSSEQWLSLRIDVLSSLIVFGSVLFAIINRNYLTVGLIGLSISSALQITEMLSYLLKKCTDLERNLVALERLREYSQVPSEAEWDSVCELPESWPRFGSTVFEDYYLKYRHNLPFVLKKINLYIKGGEKIGIVGRTGAGKSSLSLGLFRLIEAAGGKIEIDGLDISSLGLHDLRKNLTILPQEPVIFCGTIRDNLDPFNVHSDDELYQCLETAHMKQWVSTLVDGMDYDCGEGGTNLSTGQKQLLCLARAVLRKSKVLILDEATASVDVETDRLVMKTIREFFKECTVIIIAHRINTIIDVDKVVVMEDGEIVEFGEPKKLLSNPKSVFKSLHDQSSNDDL